MGTIAERLVARVSTATQEGPGGSIYYITDSGAELIHNPVQLAGRLESSVTLFFVTNAIAALEKLDVGPAMPAFFYLALTPVTVKSLSPNFPAQPTCVTDYRDTPD